VYMGSADVMQRNLDHRVETLVAISDPSVEARLLQTLEMELQPNLQSWDLGPDGSWTREAHEGLLDLHEAFEDAAKHRRKSSSSRS